MRYRDRSCDGNMCPGPSFQQGKCNLEACDAGCPGKRDVMFLVHSTTYQLRDNTFSDAKDFFLSIVKEINLDPSDESIQYALSQYSRPYSEFFNFGLLTQLEEFEWAWDAYPTTGLGTQNYLGNAMYKVAESMQPGSAHGRRHKTPGVVIILTDASSTDSVKESIPLLKEVVDRVIVVGLGYAVDKLQLKQIASKPDSDNYVEVYDSKKLKSKVKQITKAICETKLSSPFACRTAGCHDQCATSYSGSECMCGTGDLGSDGKSCSVTVSCMDENGQPRYPGETWLAFDAFTCTCSDTGNTDCDIDYSNYF